MNSIHGKTIFFFFLFFLFLFLSGCIDQNFFEYRMQCIKFSELPANDIPKCNSISDCYSSVNKLIQLNGFNNSFQIEYFKNYLSKSWYYYNKTKEKLALVHEICLSSDLKRVNELSTLINESNYFFKEAIQNLQKATDFSIDSLFRLEKELQGMEVNLIKEDDLFNSFVLLTDNINSFNSKKQDNSFAGTLVKESNNLEKFAQSLGLKGNFLKEENFFTLIEFLLKKKEIKIKTKKMMFFSFFSSLTTYFDSFQKINDSSFLLKKFNLFPITLFYSKFASKEGSVFSKYFKLINSLNYSLASLKKQNTKLIKSIDSKLIKLNSSIDYLNSFDFIPRLNELLHTNQNTIISKTKVSFNNLKNASKSFKLKQLSILNRLNKLKNNFKLNKISVGFYSSNLKKLNNQLTNLNLEIELLSNEFIEGSITQCNSRVNQIKSMNLEELKQEPEFFELNYNLTKSIKSFLLSSKQKTKLKNCYKVLIYFNEVNSLIQDFKKSDLFNLRKIKECLSDLDKSFKKFSLLQFQDDFLVLKSLKRPYNDIKKVMFSCFNLRKEILNYLNKSTEFNKFNKMLNSTKELINLIDLIKQNTEETNFFKNRLATFENNSIEENSFDQFFSLKDSINSLSALNTEVKSFFVSSFSKTISNNALITIPKVIDLNQTNFMIRVEFFNPLNQEINIPFEATLPIDFIPIKLIKKTPSIDSVDFKKKSILIHFNSFKSNPFIELLVNGNIDFIEKNEVILVDSTRALMKKTIKFTLSPAIKRLFVVIPFSNTLNPSVFLNDSLIDSSFNSKELSFFLENISKNDELIIYYSLIKPINIQVKPIKKFFEGDKTILEYNLIVKNNSSTQFKKFSLAAPINVFDGSSSLFDESFNKVNFKIISNQLVFSLDSLLPWQTRNLLFKTIFFDSERNFNSLNKITKEKLIELSNTEFNSIKENSLLLLNELQNIKEKDFKKLTELNSKAIALSEEQELFEKAKTEFFSRLNFLKSKLIDLNSQAETLKQLGFLNHSNQLKQSITSFEKKLNQSIKSSKLNYFDALKKLNSIDFNFDSFKPTKLLHSKRNQLNDFFNSLQQKSFSLNTTIDSKDLIKLLDDLDYFIYSNDFNKAKQSIDLIETKLNSLSNDLNALILSEANNVFKKINEFYKLSSKNNFNKKINLLRKIIDYDYSKQIGLTESFLNSISTSFEKIVGSGIKKKLYKFNSFYYKNEFKKALEFKDSFYPELIDSLTDLNSLYYSLDSKILLVNAWVKKKISDLEKKQGNSKFHYSLEKARNLFDQGELEKAFDIISKLNSISLDNKTGFFSLSKLNSFYSIIPLLLLMFFFLFFKKKKHKNEAFEKVIRVE